MIDYFIDTSVLDDSGNDGLSPSSPFNSFFTKIADSDDEKNIWVRRLNEDVTDNMLFSSGVLTTYISWPNEDDVHFSSRPQSGIDAGWDDDVAEKATITYTTVNASITPTVTNLIGIKIDGNIHDSKSVFSYEEDRDFNFMRCTILGARLFNDKPGVHFYMGNMSFTECKIYVKSYMVYLNQGTNGYYHIITPIFTKCEIHLSSSGLVYGYRRNNNYYVKIKIINCDVFLTKDINALFDTPLYTWEGSYGGGIRSSTIDIRLHGEFKVSYFSTRTIYSGAIGTNLVSVDGLGESSFGVILSMQGTDATFNRIAGLTAKFKNIKANTLIHENYLIENTEIDISNGVFYSNVNSTALRSCPAFKLKMTNVRINKLFSTGTTILLNCSKIGSSDYFLMARYGEIIAISCNSVSGVSTISEFYSYDEGIITFTGGMFSSEKNPCSPSSTGRIQLSSKHKSPIISNFRGMSIGNSLHYRDGSLAKGSISMSSSKSKSSPVVAVGNGMNTGILSKITSSSSIVEIYCLAIGEDDITEDSIQVVSTSKEFTTSGFSIEPDNSIWDSGVSKFQRCFKIVIPVSATENISMVTSILSVRVENGADIYIDPISIVI